MATKRRGDTNDRAAVNLKKAQISQIGRKASPRHPHPSVLKAPVSPAGAFHCSGAPGSRMAGQAHASSNGLEILVKKGSPRSARARSPGSLRSRTNKVFLGLPDTPLPRVNCERPNKASKGPAGEIQRHKIGLIPTTRTSALQIAAYTKV